MTKPGPGRYEANQSLEVAEHLDNIEADDSYGDSSSGNGWVGLVLNLQHDPLPDGFANHYIVMEDTNGFFTYEEFDTEEGARKKFEEMRSIYEVEEEVV